jgi:hypothetical protein
MDERKNEYSVESSYQDEFQLVLSRKPTEEERAKYIFKPYCFPEGSVLSVKADTNQLRRQLAAVSILKQMPHKNHEMLIRLFEDREKTRWGLPGGNMAINEWFVLLDDSRSGSFDQREFVRKALNTPDFAILEGPPGSGKTTVILELICQLVSKDKRVLLCGSTNVAIDNILERLIEKKNEQPALIDRIDLLPVRIGKPDRIEQNIAAYQIDNLLDDNLSEEERNWKQWLILEVANLVCGTTMGIVNHPKFRERGGGVYGLIYSGDTPIAPEFDYLIIDESSKTTFQEFLVPALWRESSAWHGDVMQLSPFTDSENVVYNFEQMSLGKNSDGGFETLDNSTQQAVFYLETLKKCCRWYDRTENKSGENYFIFPAPRIVLEKMFLELTCGRIEKFKNETIFAFVLPEEITLEFPSDGQSVVQKWKYENVLIRTPENINFLELIAANIVLIDSAIFESVKEKLPPTHSILQRPEWELMPHAFCHNWFQQKGTFGHHLRGRNITNTFEIVEEINRDLRERSWAQEIAWRVDSEHQLRLANKSDRRENLTSQIGDLTPFSVDRDRFEEARNLVVAMSFPSILESLVTGIKGKKPNKPSTITEGFTTDDLSRRKITLSYQHRMHPEISAFPREHFYQSSDALRDLEQPRHIREARQWDYSRYNKRSVWVDVQSPTTGSVNIYEVEEMMRHLRAFLDYAVKYPQPEGKNWEVACLAFYRGQEKLIREGGEKRVHERRTEAPHIDGLQALTGSKSGKSNFTYNRNKTMGNYSVNIRLHSVDRFQGHEADVVFLSMSQTRKDGFLDNPNRLNVSITRAKFQLVILGSHEYFASRSRSEDLRSLARACPVIGN